MATSAVQEGVLEEMMGKVSTMWAKTEFEVGFHYYGFYGPERGGQKQDFFTWRGRFLVSVVHLPPAKQTPFLFATSYVALD